MAAIKAQNVYVRLGTRWQRLGTAEVLLKDNVVEKVISFTPEQETIYFDEEKTESDGTS